MLSVRMVLLLWVCWLGWTVPLSAALQEIPGGTGFSPDSVLFDFSGLVAGAPAQDLLAKWGIRFEQSPDAIPEVDQIVQLGFVNSFVVNRPPEGGDATKPMVITFRYPARKVAFFLRDTNPQVNVKAFDNLGTNLGEVNLAATHQGSATFAIGTDDPKGISKLLITYVPDSQTPQLLVESVDDLKVEFISRPQFTIYFAQVGDGPIPGVGKLQTAFVVTNLSGSTAVGEIRFFSSQGNPLQVSDGTATASSFPLNLPPRGSFSFTTAGTAQPIAVGYAKVTANVPVDGTAIFRIVNNSGGLISEAGVGAAEGHLVSVGAVQKLSAGNIDSGIAVVNAGTVRSTAFVQLIEPSGQTRDTNFGAVQLDPGTHNAQFLSQMFSSLQNQDFTGTVRIVSDQPLALVILRTAAGLVQSSLPVGSLE
jgi:hypothetical protein